MGRGRAKAKQTKVARQLKYGVPTTDLERLQAELAGGASSEADFADDELDEDDPYAKYVAEEDEVEAEAEGDDDEYPHER